MDLASVGGLLLGVGALLATALLEGIHLSTLFAPSALLLIVGGSLGATLMQHSMHEFKQLPRVIRHAFAPPKRDFAGLLDLLVGLADKARRNGILSLQEDIPGAPHPLLQRGLNLVVDGIDPDKVREILDTQAEGMIHEQKQVAAMLEDAGGFAPTLGIVGTVLGLIHVLGNLSDAANLGGAIAVAFLATFYGLATANLFWLPLAAKARKGIHEEEQFFGMISEGLAALQAGENPKTLRERLELFLPHPVPARAKGAKA